MICAWIAFRLASLHFGSNLPPLKSPAARREYWSKPRCAKIARLTMTLILLVTAALAQVSGNFNHFGEFSYSNYSYASTLRASPSLIRSLNGSNAPLQVGVFCLIGIVADFSVHSKTLFEPKCKRKMEGIRMRACVWLSAGIVLLILWGCSHSSWIGKSSNSTSTSSNPNPSPSSNMNGRGWVVRILATPRGCMEHKERLRPVIFPEDERAKLPGPMHPGISSYLVG